MEAVEALRRVAFELERAGAPTYRVRAFRDAAAVASELSAEEIADRARQGTLTALKGIGKSTAGVIEDAVAGREPAYLAKIRKDVNYEFASGQRVRAALRGDCHTHSEWSDGGSPIREMALTGVELGHEWMVLTDHSPRLRVANGLTEERLREQLKVVVQINRELEPFRLLTGIEVDILEDGGLDQTEALLGELDVVVASVHSKLRMSSREMTKRMLGAVTNPHVDVLGHCTGRIVRGDGRPPSEFDAVAVFEACADSGVAVEINSRPDRLDPPHRLLDIAMDAGCRFSVDSDAHAPGQLDWLSYGCERAEQSGIDADQIVNTWSAPKLLEWTRRASI